MTQIITAGRDAADRLIFRDACTIETQTTSYTDGAISDDSPGLIYSGACRVKPAQAGDLDVGGGEFDVHQYLVSIPATVVGVKSGDIVTVTASTDGDLAGLVLVVDEIPHASTFSILRRLTTTRLDV